MSWIDIGIVVVSNLMIYEAGELIGFHRAKRLIWGEVERAVALRVKVDVEALFDQLMARARAEVNGDGIKDPKKGNGPGSGQ